MVYHDGRLLSLSEGDKPCEHSKQFFKVATWMCSHTCFNSISKVCWCSHSFTFVMNVYKTYGAFCEKALASASWVSSSLFVPKNVTLRDQKMASVTIYLSRWLYFLSHIDHLLVLSFVVDAVRVLEDGDLETIGRLDYEKKLNHNFTAHPKIDPDTGFFLPL